MNAAPPPAHDDVPTPPRRPRRWLPGRRVGVLFLVYLVLVVYLQSCDATQDPGLNNVLTMLLGGIAVATLVIWYLFFSGQAWWVRLLPLVAVVAVVLLFRTFYRLEAVTGALLPKFVPRSAATMKAVREAAPAPTGEAVDLLTTTEDDFPQFLGKNRDLKVTHVELARDWTSSPPELVWRQPIGAGWSGFAVVNGYAVTLEQHGEEEVVNCYDARTGKLRWAHSVKASFVNFGFGDGPRATPAIDEGRVYTLGATGRLRALDGATGELLWEKDVSAEHGMTPEDEEENLPYGRSNSPLVVGDLLVVPAGGPAPGRRVSVVAYDKRTGERVWQGGDRQISCSSPAVATLGGVLQILSVNEDTVSGHAAATGDVLWEHPWPGSTYNRAHVSQPVPVEPNRVFLSKGYGLGAALLELELRGDGRFDVHELWHESRVLRTKFTNVVITGGHVYGLSEGILECVELETGQRVWKRGRYGHGQVLLVGDLLLVMAESGEMLMIEATPERASHVLGRFQALDGKTWNNLALYGSLLLVRNAQEAAAYRLPLA